jgi:hypothetical protein
LIVKEIMQASPKIILVEFKEPKARIHIPVRTGLRRAVTDYLGLTYPKRQKAPTITTLKLPKNPND